MSNHLSSATQLQKSRSKIYINIYGLSGCGKTYSSLLIATNLATSNDRVIIIDTENRSDIYSDDFAGVMKINPKNLNISTISEIIIEIKQSKKYDAVVIDSLTPLWDGADGLLTNADKEGSQNARKWIKPKQQITAFTQLLRNSGLHIITTCLAKEERGQDMKKTDKIIPIFERDKFSPYLDIQLLLDNKDGFEGNIKEVIKSWCPSAKNILQVNKSINIDMVRDIQSILLPSDIKDDYDEYKLKENISIIQKEERVEEFFQQTKNMNQAECAGWYKNLNQEDQSLYKEYAGSLKDRREEYQLQMKEIENPNTLNMNNLI
jgi:hypothetical protein